LAAKNRRKEGDQRFELKAGREGRAWGGVRTEGDPSSNPDFQPRLAINVRPDGGGYKERPGFTPFNTSALHHSGACIKSLFDLPMATPVKVWVVGDGCPAVSASVGFYIGAFDPEQDPDFQAYYYYSAATTGVVIGEFDDYVHALVDADLRRINLIVQPWGQSALPIGGAGTDTPLYTHTGFTGKALLEFDDKLFQGLGAASGTSKISTWDGTTHRDDRSSLEIPSCFAHYRVTGGGDAIVAGYSTGNLISYRPTGSSGSWTDVSPGAGTCTAYRMLSYKDTLWITTGGEDLFSFDGTTLTRVQPATTGIAAGSVTRGLAIANSNTLYMLYNSGTSVRVAKYDGTTWTAIDKNLTTQFATLQSAKDLVWYRGYLIAAGTTASLGARLYAVAETGVTGSWTEITPHAATNGDIDQLLVV
jgi:hypothetical protein